MHGTWQAGGWFPTNLVLAKGFIMSEMLRAYVNSTLGPCNWRWVEKVVVVQGGPQKPTSVPITISTAAGRVCDVIRGQLAPSRQHSERVRV